MGPELLERTLRRLPRYMLKAVADHAANRIKGSTCLCHTCTCFHVYLSRAEIPAPSGTVKGWEVALQYDEIAKARMEAITHDGAEVQRIMVALAEWDEAELRRLLGAWVSEEEPTLFLGPDASEIRGIGPTSEIGQRALIVIPSSEGYRQGRRALFPWLYRNSEYLLLQPLASVHRIMSVQTSSGPREKPQKKDGT